MLYTIIPVVAGIGLILCLVIMGLRYKWGSTGEARPAGGGYWILSLVALWLWWSALSSGLSAQAKRGTYQALAALPVVTAEDIRTKPELVGRPVVVQDQAFCHETLASGQNALAVRIKYSGQEEVEGEDYDYISIQDYGQDQEIARFSLGAKDSPVRVDNELLTVVPSAGARRVTVPTNEYSAAAGGNLEEYHDIAEIGCESMVTVTGLVTKQGEFFLLEPLNPHVALLSDRPWASMIEHAGSRASEQGTRALMWFLAAVAVGLAQLAGGLAARKRA